jgi:hypothetical protein
MLCIKIFFIFFLFTITKLINISTLGDTMSSADPIWFSIIKDENNNKNPMNKKNTKQTKLPKELTDGASVAVDDKGKPIKHLNFNRKPKPSKPASANKIKPNSKQKKLF